MSKEGVPLVTARVVAMALGVSDSHVYEMAQLGEIPYHKLGRSIRFNVHEVLEATRVGAE